MLPDSQSIAVTLGSLLREATTRSRATRAMESPSMPTKKNTRMLCLPVILIRWSIRATPIKMPRQHHRLSHRPMVMFRFP